MFSVSALRGPSRAFLAPVKAKAKAHANINISVNTSSNHLAQVLRTPSPSRFRHPSARTLPVLCSRHYTAGHEPKEDPSNTVAFFLSDLFPQKVAKHDFITKIYSKYRANSIKSEITQAFKKSPSDAFALSSIEDRIRDGGLRVYFKLSANELSEVSQLLESFEKYVQLLSTSHPAVYNIFENKSYLVKGVPFKEDLLNYIPSRSLKVTFYGSGLAEDQVFKLFRQYGKIVSIHQADDSKSGQKSVYVNYTSPKCASIAFNCLYGTVKNETRITLNYQHILKKNVITEWFSQHTKFIIPILIATIATILYSLFEPIRRWSIENKLTKRFKRLYNDLVKYLTALIPVLPYFGRSSKDTQYSSDYDSFINSLWNKNIAKEEQLKQVLNEPPETLILVSGSEDIGKSKIVSSALENKQYVLEIDSEKLAKSSDFSSQLKLLANMLGYSPYFSSSYQLVLLLDRLLTSTTGQPSGFYNSPSSRFTDILDTTALAIDSFKFHQMEKIKRNANKNRDNTNSSAGNHTSSSTNAPNLLLSSEDSSKADTTSSDPDASSEDIDNLPVDQIPVIVVSNFMNHSMEFSNNIVKWAARLVTSGSAHVIFTSANKSIHRELQQAIPLKTLNIITLGEASLSDSLNYVFNQLKTAGYYDQNYQLEDFIVSHNNAVSLIGSFKKDLDYYIHELISGKSGQESLDSVVSRAIIETTKLSLESKSFQSSDSKSWTQAQFWYLVKNLAKDEAISYTKTKMSSLFNGNDSAILDLQSHSLISVEFENGIPTFITTGKPIYSLAFAKLIETPTFSYPLQYYFHKENIALETANLSKYESELKDLGFFDLVSSINHGHSREQGFIHGISDFILTLVYPVIYLGSVMFYSKDHDENLDYEAVKSMPTPLQLRVAFLLKKMKKSQVNINYHNQMLSEISKHIDSF